MKTFTDYVKFREYLKSLPDEGKPFGCPDAKVLPEEVITNEARLTYKSGDIICSRTPGLLRERGSHLCHLSNLVDVQPNAEGVLEAKCGHMHHKFKLKIVGFELKD